MKKSIKLKIVKFVGLLFLILGCGNVYQKRVDNSKECVFKQREIIYPKTIDLLGDTINIKNIDGWISGLKMTNDNLALEKLINRQGIFFQINETEKYAVILFFEDEGDYFGIYLYSLNKENCEILGEELLAEKTSWEHGYKETFSILKDNFKIRRVKQTGAKDWGDYTMWKRDTIVSMITFSENGKIIIE